MTPLFWRSAAASPAIVPYERRWRSGIRAIIVDAEYAHTHLDWQDVDDWLEYEAAIVRVAVRGQRVVGVLALSAPLHGTAWVRLAGAADREDAGALLAALWAALLPDLSAAGLTLVAWLMIRDWTDTIAAALGFTAHEEIVTLRRAALPPPPLTVPEAVTLRPFVPDDVPAMAVVDQAAFTPPWQMSAADVRAASRASARGTVALLGDRLVGYQLSTLYFDGAHLARLAVDPAVQGQGIGGALVADVVRHFARRGVHAMTVNTQRSNTTSQRVYTRLGFRHNGYDLPVWVIRLPACSASQP